MTDPMTGYEQAESEAVERQDEARREQHWREAEQAARLVLDVECETLRRCPMVAVSHLLSDASFVQQEDKYRRSWPHGAELADFATEYGLPALLRVIATALEAK